MVAVLAIVTGAGPGTAIATVAAAAVATVAADCAVVIVIVGVVAQLALGSLPAKCTLFLDGALGLRIVPRVPTRVLGWFVALVGAFVVAVVAVLVDGLPATLPATL